MTHLARFRLTDGSGDIRLKHVVEDTDRRGNVRVYYRKPGQPKVRLREKPGTDAFLLEYRRAVNGEIVPKRAPRPPTNPESLTWLCERYYESAEFKGLNARTQHVRKLILGHVLKADGAKPYKLLEARHIRRARDLKSTAPESANGMVKALRAVFGWAVQPGVELAERNPAKDVPYLEAKGDGHHSWTDAEVAQFERRHPIGTKARLALSLLLFTSQRRSDIVLFGASHVKDGWLHFTQQKNKDRKPISLQIPIRAELQAILDASPLGKDTFLDRFTFR